MKKIHNASLIGIIIGAVAILMGIYELATNGSFNDYFFLLFIGTTLAGSAYFYNQTLNKKKED